MDHISTLGDDGERYRAAFGNTGKGFQQETANAYVPGNAIKLRIMASATKLDADAVAKCEPAVFSFG
jgi:hypothetical protein